MSIESEFEELKDTAIAELSGFGFVNDRDRAALLERAICLRSLSGVGVQITIDWQEPFVFVLIWSPKEPHCPIGYRNVDGYEVKMYLQEALRRLGVDSSGFNKRMLKLRGDLANIPLMFRISLDFLLSSIDIIQSNRDHLFP